MDGWRTWRAAMADALYGDRGFYRSSGAPARHFRTSAATARWTAAVHSLVQAVDAGIGEPDDFTVVDLGAGGGELLAGLAALAPPRWRLAGVDVAPRPAGLPARIAWSAEPPDRHRGVLVAVEWLDVVPLDVVVLTDDGPRVIEVAADGRERLGGPPDARDLDWLGRWWWPVDAGDRAEIGRPRDEAWADAVARLDRGVAVAVDYAVRPDRDVAGTLTGYRDGRQVVPVPDGSCDVTAHVLMDACAGAVRDADDTRLVSQRDALRRLGVDATVPRYGGDPSAYLGSLSAVGEAAELLDPSGLGGFTWLLHAKGVALPL